MIDKVEAAKPVPKFRAVPKPPDSYGYESTVDTLKDLEQAERSEGVESEK